MVYHHQQTSVSTPSMEAALQQPIDKIKRLLDEIVLEFAKPEHGLSVRWVIVGEASQDGDQGGTLTKPYARLCSKEAGRRPSKLSAGGARNIGPVIAYKRSR